MVHMTRRSNMQLIFTAPDKIFIDNRQYQRGFDGGARRAKLQVDARASIGRHQHPSAPPIFRD